MYASTKVGKRTTIGVRHGGFVLFVGALLLIGLAPWFAIIGGAAGLIWIISQHPQVSAQFIGGYIVFAPIVGGLSLLVTWLTSSGVVVWLVPLVTTAIASALYTIMHPEQRKPVSK